ncbi:MAG: winged helix-turn-helix transcriptional regulator [Anaerolineales bacterium]|nr:winged helix-turn-helix transcriptional regulator [Anaerolineales bacterium]
MSPFALNLEKTRVKSSLVSVDPAINAFGSMILISKAKDDPGIHEWVQKTRAQMSAEELTRHYLVTIGLHYAITPRKSDISFETYLDDLDNTPPSVLRERLLGAYSEICLTEEGRKAVNQSVQWDEVLSSVENYIDFLISRFGPELVDTEMETRAYQYVIDPAALKQLITGHIRWFWKNYLQAEWKRVSPMIEESVKAFNKIDMRDMTRAEIVQFITGKELTESKWANEVEGSQEVYFVPNAHIGPYIHLTKVQNDFYVHFGAHLPEGSDVQVPELDRAEIVSKLSALADETRLQILQMIANNGEMRATELMEATQLSQPSISRYLGQLTANGFLQERRLNGAKAYTLNHERIEKTLKAISAFLLVHTKEA